MCEDVLPRPPQNFITRLMGENSLLIYLICSRILECVEQCLHALHKTSLRGSWVKTILIYLTVTMTLNTTEVLYTAVT